MAPRRARSILGGMSLVLLLGSTACGGPQPSDFTEATARAYLDARGISATPDDLVRAVGTDALDLAAAILAAGVSPDALEGLPLAVAARLGHLEMLHLLLDAGADPNRSGPRGQTPLALAVIHRQDETIDLLLEAGANPDGGSQSSTRPLLFAIDAEVAERLLQAGASVDARDTNGGTALMNAAILGDSALVDLLLEHRADVNATDKAGRPALLYATVARYGEIRKRLLAAGADPLPGHEIARSGYTSFLGRYGEPGGPQYEIVADPGMLLLVEQGPDGLLFAAELAPLSPARFYRSNDPGATIFELRIEDGRVTALARMQSSTWEVFPRVDASAADRPSAR